MRIFHLVPNLNFGGLQKVVRLLALSQVQSGHSVTVGCWTNVSNHPEAQEELRRAGARVIYLRRASDGGLTFGKMSLFSNLKSQLSAGKVDILHVHNPFSYYLYGALAARAVGKTKIVNTLHATAMFENPRFSRKRRAAFWTAAMLTDGLVFVCSTMDRFVRSRFFLPGREFFVVDNGIDFAPFLAVPARQPRNEIVFGSAGRMSPEKNHRSLIEAFSLLRRKHDNVRLRILGGGPLESELREQVRKLGLQDAVEISGFSNDVTGFLGQLDVYVLPSDSEALPLSLLEAIASGLPVVATRVGAVPEVVQKTDSGWLCPPKNCDALMAAMESAILFSDLRNKGERARRLVAEQYSVERMTRDYEQVYQKVLN